MILNISAGVSGESPCLADKRPSWDGNGISAEPPQSMRTCFAPSFPAISSQWPAKARFALRASGVGSYICAPSTAMHPKGRRTASAAAFTLSRYSISRAESWTERSGPEQPFLNVSASGTPAKCAFHGSSCVQPSSLQSVIYLNISCLPSAKSL